MFYFSLSKIIYINISKKHPKTKNVQNQPKKVAELLKKSSAPRAPCSWQLRDFEDRISRNGFLYHFSYGCSRFYIFSSGFLRFVVRSS